jgi:hypothetical protein
MTKPGLQPSSSPRQSRFRQSASNFAINLAYNKGASDPGILLEYSLRLYEFPEETRHAKDILLELLFLHPSFAVARIWRAYFLLHEPARNPTLLCAFEDLAELTRRGGELGAAAHFMRAGILMYLDLDLSSEMIGSELRDSIRLAPDWVSNKVNLAEVQRAMGCDSEARALLKQAEKSMAEESKAWSFSRRMFESLITWRITWSPDS